MGTLVTTVAHLLDHVLPAIEEYELAEASLSKAHASGDWSAEAKTARRKAAELAVAMDGLADRVQQELHLPLETIRAEVSKLCLWPNSTLSRQEAFERVHGVANAYKHSELKKPSHVLRSFDDVLAVGLGFGLDGFGVGKFSGVEVLVKDKQARSWKFLGDVPVVLNGWCSFLTMNGAALPKTTLHVCGLDISIGQ